MGKAKPGAAIDAISGHVGSLQFWLSGNGNLFGSTNRPRQTQTARQRQALAAWTSMVKAWAQDTSPTDRTGWHNFGTTNPTKTKCGGTAPLNGFEAFARTNVRLEHIGQPLRLSPPSSFTSNPPGTCTLSWAPGPPDSLSLSATTNPSATQVPIIRGIGPQFPGALSTKRRTATLLIAAAGVAGPWELAADWILKYGAIVSGQRLTVTLEYEDFTSGAQSTKSTATVLIT